jgi:hypothetical protein
VDMKQRMMDIRKSIMDRPGAWRNIRRLDELALTVMADRGNRLGERDNFRVLLGQLVQRMEGTIEDEYLQASVEAAALHLLRIAVRQQEWDQAAEMLPTLKSFVQNGDRRNAVLLFELSLQQRNGNYTNALATLDLIEQFEPEEKVAEWYDPPDYLPVRNTLLSLAGLPTQTEPAQAPPQSRVSHEASAIAAPGERPSRFELKGAYPNPFNPRTTIPFALPERADVRIEIFDLAGRRVAVLTDASYAQGRHEVFFDAESFPSGVYLIRARMVSEGAGPQFFTRRVTLVK